MGEQLFVVTTPIIREVFILTQNIVLLEKIELGEFQSRYKAQALYLHVGPLREHFVRIGGLSSSTLEPLMKKFFNPRAQALYLSLCRVLGVVEIDHVPRCLVFMMVQIL